jgi:23S rRNA pseudouridine2605 synthase
VHAPKDNQKRTLDRVLSKFGVGSRTEARSWIGGGRVTVNGKKVQTPDAWIDPERDQVALDGHPVTARQKQYLLLYKPKGYLTTYKDQEGRPTVYDLLGGIKDFVFPLGRLDQDTTGLLILSNDSAFGDHITSPESKVPKTYLVKASVLLDDAQLEQLRQGLTLADGPTRPAIVKRVRDGAKYTFFEITITEGRNRQVRRMVEALGAKVLKLVRTGIGAIEIGGLEIGKYREMTEEEISGLRGTRSLKRPLRSGHLADPPDRRAAQAPRRTGKSARWAGGTRRRGHND